MADLKESDDDQKETQYSVCDIYRLYNDMWSASTLILDVRSYSEYETNHIQNSEHFEIPDDFKFTNSKDLLLKLNKNIEEFKGKVFEKLKVTKKNDLLIYCYASEKELMQKYNVMYQLSIIFGLQKRQAQFLQHPGFSLFEQTYPFLCSKYIKEEELEKGSTASSIFDAIKNKNMQNIKNDGTFYGLIKAEDSKYPNSIISDKLYLGNAEHSQDFKVLQNLKITHVINATLKYENAFASFGKIKYLQLAIDDKENENFEPFWQQIMEFMQCINKDENRLFVHCEMGISRSATICIAYLMKTRKMTLYDAYFYVLDRRRICRPNSAFLKQLEKYEKSLFGKSTLQRVEEEIRQIYFKKLSSQQQGV